jgi:hypothetical protein
LTTRARQGRGAKVKPGMGSIEGCNSKSTSFHGDSKRKCCIIETKKRNSVLLAKVSPMQLLFPEIVKQIDVRDLNTNLEIRQPTKAEG